MFILNQCKIVNECTFVVQIFCYNECGMVMEELIHIHHTCKKCKKNLSYFFITFEKQHANNRLHQFLELCNLKMEENTLVQVHINKFYMITNQLANIYHIFFDENLAFKCLKGLPPSFHTSVISLNLFILMNYL
jgi:hypothetical protein